MPIIPIFLVIFLLVAGSADAAVSVDAKAPVYTGTAAVLQVQNALPGSTVRIYASHMGVGKGPCQGVYCLSILAPVEVLGEVVTDSSGTGNLSIQVPDTQAGGMFLQPAQLSPADVGSVSPLKVWKRKRVLMIGDSITEGQQSQPSGLQYTDVTTEILGIPYVVRQIGCGGATSWDWSSFGGVTLCGGQFWDPNVYTVRAKPNLPADIVTVMLGTNDSTGFFESAPIPWDQYLLNMTDLVTNLQHDGAGVVMLLSPPSMCAGTDPAVVTRLQNYRQVLNDMCTTMAGVLCGPDIYTLLTDTDFAGCDVHPNGIGHEKIGVAVADAIRGL